MCWHGSMVEQLICNQQVEGSIPFASSIFLGRLQSGQMQRTVNPSTMSSMVRIHPCPPKRIEKRLDDSSLFLFTILWYEVCSVKNKNLISQVSVIFFLFFRRKCSLYRNFSHQSFQLALQNSFAYLARH